jgi:hypothetical protein
VKKELSKIIVSLVVVSLSLSADISDYTYKSTSLIGVEGGYSLGSSSGAQRDISDTNFGLKVGAQSKNYRVFIGLNRDNASTGENFFRAGVSVNYLFDLFDKANLFVGLNGGFTNGGDLNSGKEYPTYYGGDIGIYVTQSRDIDYEFGIRSSKTENFETLKSAYVSLILKYEIE